MFRERNEQFDQVVTESYSLKYAVEVSTGDPTLGSCCFSIVPGCIDSVNISPGKGINSLTRIVLL